MEQIKDVLEEISNLEISPDNIINISTARNYIESKLSLLPELEGTEIINSHIKSHFKFKSEIVKGLVKHNKGLKKITKRIDSKVLKDSDFEVEKVDKQTYQENILKELETSVSTISVNASQDFVNDSMVYTIINNGIPYMITSSRNAFKFDDADTYGIIIKNKGITSSNFSVKAATEYKKGEKTANIYECFVRIKEHISKYIVFQEKEIYDFLSIWIIGTYIYKTFRYYPYLWLNADKGSGKSKVMEVISPIAFNSILAINHTAATIFRCIDSDCSTLLIDEFEKMQKDLQEVITVLLNGGFHTEGKTYRMEGNGTFTKREFSLFSPKVLAGINDISDVLQDRCIKIKLFKKKNDDFIERYKVDKKLKDNIADLRDDLYICGLMYAKEIKEIYDSNTITFPEELSDRECDIWEVIFSISHFIDSKVGTKLQDEMRKFAIRTSKERSKDNIEKNISYKLLNFLSEIIPTLTPLRQKDEIKYYKADDVFNALRSADESLKINTRHYLTSQLKNRFQIQNDRITVNNTKVYVYCLSDKQLEELLERYNLNNLEEEKENPDS